MFNKSSIERLPTRKISVVLPTLNEVENIELIYNELINQFNNLQLDYEIIFVDDNSSDGTIAKIKALSLSDKNVKYLIMSKRFGDQACLVAGLECSSGEATIIMDSDLQHPPKYIPEMIESWENGADVVIMQREKAGHKKFLKTFMEIMFYKVLSWLSEEKIYLRFSGFSLIDNKVISHIKKFNEYEPFLRGIISLVGFKHSILNYIEDERKNGSTKYSYFNQAKLGLVGITSFSIRPLYLSLFAGFMSVSISFFYGIYILLSKLYFNGVETEGWTSVVLLVIFFGGIQLITVGILGIYVGKNFIESKRRPRYIVNESDKD